MRYRFSLGRGEAAMVLGGATVVGALLFATGVMTGMAFSRGRAAAPADEGAMVVAPDPAAAADSATIARAVADSAAAAQGAPPAPAQPAAFTAPADGIGGPAPDDAMGVNADGWSVPAGYAPPAASPSRWAALPAAAGQDVPDPASPSDAVGAASRYAAAVPATDAQRGRVAPEAAYVPRAAPGEARFRAYDGGGGPYALQVGRFREEKAAMKVVDELRARGHEVYLYTVAERGAPLFSVRMDRFGDRESAMLAAERLEQREQLAAVVVPTEPR